MNEDDDDYIPGLHDDRSVPQEERIARCAEHLREWGDLEMAIQMAASSSIHLADVEAALCDLIEISDGLCGVQEAALLAIEAGRAGLKIGAKSLKVMLAEREKKKITLSTAGMIGAKVRHELSNKFKEWVLQECASVRGSDADVARKLATRIPGHLVTASKSPERFIYDTLRSRRAKEGLHNTRGRVS